MAIPDNTTSVNGTNKQVQDIQTGIKVSNDNKVTGKSLYVTGINNAGGDGNYLVLEFPQAKDPENTVKCQFEGGEETKLDASDYQYLIKLTESGKKPITITITGNVNATRTLDISGVILSPKD